MVQLVSPGVAITVEDSSAYPPSGPGTVPFILVASEENKQADDGSIASGTLKENAGRVYLMTSQRDLANTFGVPTFYKSGNGTPLHGYELNEYGLESARSYLGLANRAYIVRADVDLAQLHASVSAPTSPPRNGTHWLDLNETTWGIHVWDLSTGQFNYVLPRIIDDSDDLVAANDPTGLAGYPLDKIGVVGEYAVVAAEGGNSVYYKTSGYVHTYGTPAMNETKYWVPVGSTAWKDFVANRENTMSDNVRVFQSRYNRNPSRAWAAASAPTGSVWQQFGNEAGNSVNFSMKVYNEATQTFSPVPTSINTNIFDATKQIGGNDPSSTIPEGTVIVEYGALQDLRSDLYNNEEPFEGLSLLAWRRNSNSSTYIKGVTAPVFTNIGPGSGGNTILSIIDQLTDDVATLEFFTGGGFDSGGAVPVVTTSGSPATVATITSITVDTDGQITDVTWNEHGAGYATGDTLTFTQGNTRAIYTILAGDHTSGVLDNFTGKIITQRTGIEGDNTDANGRTRPDLSNGAINGRIAIDKDTVDLDTFILTLNNSMRFTNIEFGSDNGRLTIEHSKGGDIWFVQGNIAGFSSTSINDALRGLGIITQENLNGMYPFIDYRYSVGTFESRHNLVATNWVPLTYEADFSEPVQPPFNGQLWYNTEFTADILINTVQGWAGLKHSNVPDNLPYPYERDDIDSNGPIFSASEPTTQSDGGSLADGDLWIDTSDLENYPRISRYDTTNENWTLIDNTDQTSPFGIVFADARWSATGPDADPGIITELMKLDFVDPDAPDPALYPEGILLFNTRRSGFNVKEYRKNHITLNEYREGNPRFNDESVATYFPDRWVSKAGNAPDGSGYFGRKAQRRVVVRALKSAINSNTSIREEQRLFNLIAAPGYPELISNMVSLNIDRKETGHVIGDSPFRLTDDAAVLEAWSNNAKAAFDNGEDGLVSNYEYMSVYWPSGLSSDLTGAQIAVPPSHMMLRTMAYNDSVGYPWFAPAGIPRGRISNANAIGFINPETNEFESIANGQGLRDVLYANGINPITFLPEAGIVNYGNKTRLRIPSALDRTNVARLVAYMRYVTALAMRPFLFQPLDELTESEAVNVLNSICIDLASKRAIGDWLVVPATDNIRRNRSEMWIDVLIEPVKATEFIYVPIRLEEIGGISAG